MKNFFLCISLVLISSSAYAQKYNRVFLILQPASDNLLIRIKDNMSRYLTGTVIDAYLPLEQTKPYDLTGSMNKLSEAKEAYEFLKFDESIDDLNAVVSELIGMNSAETIKTLRESYLYLAMNYLALDKESDAKQIINNYLCITNKPNLNPDLWPPNLIDLIKKRLAQNTNALIKVTITTLPGSADILIDSTEVGVSPVQISLPACRHFIKIKKRGYLIKESIFIPGNSNNHVNFNLAIDPMSVSEHILSKEQINNLLVSHKADAIVIVSRRITQTTAGSTTWIKASLIKAHSHKTTLFIYNNRKQSVINLAGFIQPGLSGNESNKNFLKPLANKIEKGKPKPPHRWYKNKWFWTAGAAILTGGLVFAFTRNNRHQSSSTGSISMKW